jgi:hypothetical protein
MKKPPRHSRPSLRRSIARWLWSERHALIVAIILGVAIGVVWNHVNPVLHQSSIELYIDEPFHTTEEADALQLKPTNGLLRLIHDASGEAMLRRLCEIYDLPSLYGFHSELRERDRLARQVVKRRIEVYPTMFESVRITVMDGDRDVAASMARTIFLELKADLERRAMQQVGRTAAIYDLLSAESASDAEQDKAALSELLRDLQSVEKHLGEDAEILRLNMLASQVQNAFVERNRLRTGLRGQQVLAQQDHLPQLVLVQDATLDLGPSLKVAAFQRTVIVVFLTICAALLMRAIWSRHRSELIEMVDALGRGGEGRTRNHYNGSSSKEEAPNGSRVLEEADSMT